MRIFRRQAQRGTSSSHLQRSTPSLPSRPVATPPSPPPVAATPPPPPQETAPPKVENSGNLFQGLASNFSRLGQQFKEASQLPPGVGLQEALRASQGVKLSDEERAQIAQASGVLDRLAGADGMWNQGDLKNNVRQLEASGDLNKAVNQEIGKRWGQELGKRGPLGKALVNGHMRRNYGNYQQQGMGQARQMAEGQLKQGIQQAGTRPNAGHSAEKASELGPEAAKNAGKPISRGEMEQFQKAMEMLQSKSKEQGLPQVSFPNGVPASFLQAIKDGKSPQDALKEAGAVVTWGNGQKTDYGKKPEEPKATPETKAAAELPAAETRAAEQLAQEVPASQPPATAQQDGQAETDSEPPAEPTAEGTDSAGDSEVEASAQEEPAEEAGIEEAGLEEAGGEGEVEVEREPAPAE